MSVYYKKLCYNALDPELLATRYVVKSFILLGFAGNWPSLIFIVVAWVSAPL